MALSRRPGRSRPIRLFLISMFAVPLVSLVALYAYAASTTIANAVVDQKYNQGVKLVTAGFSGLTQGLPQEQAATYVWLSSGRRVPNASMLAARKLVDAGILNAQNVMRPVQGDETPHARAAQDALFAAVGQLGKTRAAVDAGTISPLAAFQVYSNLVDDQWRFYFSSNSKDASFTDVSIAATNMSYAIPMGAREATLVGGALASGGQMSAAARQVFTATVGIRRTLMSMGIAGLTPDLGSLYTVLENSQQYQRFQAMEDQIMAAPAGQPLPVNPAAWQQASGAYLAAMGKAGLVTGAKLGSMSNSLANKLVLEAVLAGGLGLARRGRLDLPDRVVRPQGDQGLTGLNDSVRGMADERLPRVVERLRRGEDVDVQAESPPPPAGTITEISRIARVVRHCAGAAVEAAVDQARLRKGVNQVFLNISTAQPVAAAPAAGHARRDGAADQRAGGAGRPVPPRPPHHPHAPARRGPDHLVGLDARPRLARPGAGRRRAAGRGRRGRGLRPGRREQRIRRPGGRHRGQRRHPPDRRAGRERHRLLPAQHPDRGQGRTAWAPACRRGRRPRARHVRHRTRRHQPAAGQPARVRPGQQRSARAVRGRASWRPGTRSRSRCAGPSTAAPRP